MKTFFSHLNNWASETSLFAHQFLKYPKTLGTPFAFSSYVAGELVGFVKNGGEQPRSYLEVGAGSGAVTKHLVKKLGPNDKLYLVEINEAFCSLLKEKFKNNANVIVVHSPIQEWVHEEHSIDVIVSTVPLNSLSSAQDVQQIFDTYQRLIKPEGVISFAEYVGTSTMTRRIKWGVSAHLYSTLQKVKNAFFDLNQIERKVIFSNFPPARIIHCKINNSSKSLP
jgi:phospholipid N-methyltransferase